MARAAKKASRRDVDLGARFTAAEKARVARAMAKSGKNLSDFVRAAVLGSADQALAGDSLAAFAPALGVIDVKGDFGRRAEALYTARVLEKHEAGRRTRGARGRAGRPKEAPPSP
ncbi:MAG: DUF1778 domain-containing protein [Cyanobacteria bacterium REEB65]|nr:DUF1778 domain-containing protein [Cyanobacteria bacterium REEB65]